MKDIQGIQRGKCNSCECVEYRTPGDDGKYACGYCGHRPVHHVRIVPLGECRTKDCDCDKYDSDDKNSYSDCQYCGCSASTHKGAEALRKPQTAPSQYHPIPIVPVPVMSVAGSGYTTRGSVGGTALSGGIQPKMSESGVPLQSSAHGTCSYPGCPYPKRIEGTKVHQYCSKSCAIKLDQRQTSFHTQKLAVANQAAKSSHQPTQTGQLQAHTVVPSSQKPPIICKKCNRQPANPGRGWCESCFSQQKM